MKLRNKLTNEIREFSDEYGIAFWEQPEPNKQPQHYSYHSIKELTNEWEDIK